MTMTPYAYQAEDLRTLAANDYIALINIEPGGGKTPLATWAIRDSGAKRVLIIAPDQTHSSAWIPTVRNILGVEARVIGNTGKAKRAAMFDFEMGFDGIYLVTPQLLTRADSSMWSGDMLIVDEGHMLNAPKSKGQRKLSGYLNDPEPISMRFGKRLFLSGTAWRNSFERAWATMRFLWPERDGWGELADYNFYRWQNERMSYETVYTNQKDRNGNTKTVKKFLNEKDPGHLISLMPCVIIHKRRERCCKHHPKGFLPTDAPQEIKHVITLGAAQKKAIRELEDHYFTWLEDQPLAVDLSLTQLQRIRQMTLGVPTLDFYMNEEGEEKVRVSYDPACESPFVARMLEELEELDGEPAVVYLESQAFAEVTVKKLNKAGYKAFEYSGKTRKDRDSMLAKFGPEYQVAVVVLAAGGTGLDGLQRVTKTEFWLERSVDETNNVQAEARADRLGGVGQVQRHFFVDDEGRAEGRMSTQLEKRRALAATLRKAVQ